ncbi:MAG: hypothetical protein H0X41_14365 [Chitinophagaceae bacterium]|nr:hypothetical protein [Chitinophagaceae bacterium]
MRLIKLAFISIVVFAIILFLLSLLIPSHVRISRAINMQGSSIEKTIADLGTWKKWNDLYNDSAKVIIISAKPDLVETIWSYKDNHIPGNFRIEHSSGTSVVQWYFDFKLRWYPWEKFGSITFDKQFGPPMERSLNNLKKLVENSP